MKTLKKRRRKRRAKEGRLEGQEEISIVQVGALAVQEVILLQKRCIRRSALNASRNVKFHSSLQKAEMFSAKNVIGRKKDINS
jgi:hypothetical protein